MRITKADIRAFKRASRRESRKTWLTVARFLAEFSIRESQSQHWPDRRAEMAGLFRQLAGMRRVCKIAPADADPILSELRTLAEAEPEAIAASVAGVRAILATISAELEEAQ